MSTQSERRSMLILAGWIAYVIFTYVFFDNVAILIQEGGILKAYILYLLFNPAYILLFYSCFKLSKKDVWRKFIGCVSLVLSFDIVSAPRLLIKDSLTNGAATTTNMGSIAITNLNKIFSHETSFFMFYMIIPIALFIIAMMMFGFVKFEKGFIRGNIGG